MTLDLFSIKGIVWDLDNTLYHFTGAFIKSCNEAAAGAARELGIDLSYDDTLKLAARSEQEYGYSMHGYVTDHGLSYASLHFPFHQRIDEGVIAPVDGMKNALAGLNLPQVILTNGSRCWALRALKKAGIDHLFDAAHIIPMEDVGFEPKARSKKGFKKALDILGVSAKNALMVDDLDRNLIIPHGLGFQTAYIYRGEAMQNLPHFIDAQYRCAMNLIETDLKALSL